jgi:hypothetical protein
MEDAQSEKQHVFWSSKQAMSEKPKKTAACLIVKSGEDDTIHTSSFAYCDECSRCRPSFRYSGDFVEWDLLPSASAAFFFQKGLAIRWESSQAT